MRADLSLPAAIYKCAEGFHGKRRRTVVQAGPGAVAGQGPSAVSLHPPVDGYAAIYADAARARDLSIIRDPALHFALYGRQQGRTILHRINDDVQRIVVIAPSYRKQCGIGEYGRYLASILELQVDDVRVVRTSAAALDLGAEFLNGAMVLVNHGPGLFDGLNPRLSQGESTTQLLQNLNRLSQEFGALPLIIHHSLLDTNHDVLFSRQQQILNSDIPSVTFISSAGRHFFLPAVELGVSPVPVPDHSYDGNRNERPEAVGFFGFFQYGGKDFDSLFHLVRELRGRLVGSVATANAEELRRFHETIQGFDLPYDLGSGWISDTELLERLSAADYFYLPQNDYDHWNNSATARFVTNLPRPLFLPPHHPFLDMADGSIFATREDLPRIVAHFRENRHFDQAVARVRAFRARADMSNTAVALRTELVERTVAMGRLLLELPAVLSAERFEELSGPAREAFAQAQGAPEGATLEQVLPHLPALYRAPAPRQYWRKHYELGDLIHATLLDSVHSAYVAIAKRHVRFEELIGILSDTLDPGLPMLWHWAETARAAILRALQDKGGLFHDPEIVLLENGEPVQDWLAAIEPARIGAFATAAADRRRRVQDASARTASAIRPPVTNLAELLTIPPAILRDRPAPLDLSLLDLDWVQAARFPSERMNRLVAQASAAGIVLGDHLVLDHPEPPEIEPKVTVYAVEDFIYHTGDKFVLNAVRRIDKRSPFPIELLVLGSMQNSLGKTAVLQHLLRRAEGRVQIVNLDTSRNYETEATAFRRFMTHARDPLMGLIEARNAYSILTRNNNRWCLSAREDADAITKAAGTNAGMVNLIYALLSQSPSDRANPAIRRNNPVWHMDRQGRFRRRADVEDDGLSLEPDVPLTVNTGIAGVFDKASMGFYPTEDAGAWTRGAEGSVLVWLDPAAFTKPGRSSPPILRLRMGFFGSAFFDGPRRLTVDLQPAAITVLSMFEDDAAEPPPTVSAEQDIVRDNAIDLDLPLADLPGAGVYTLRFAMDKVTSPVAAGVSADQRDLGVLLHSLVLIPSVLLPPAAVPAGAAVPA